MPGIEFRGDILPMGQPDNASRTVLDTTVTLTQTLLKRQKKNVNSGRLHQCRQRVSLRAAVGQYHLPSDQHQPHPSSWPSSSSPTSTTNIFYVCSRQLLLRHSSVLFSSPLHKPTNLTVNIPRGSHVTPLTRHHVNPSPSTLHPQNGYSTLSHFERPVWIHLSSC